MVKPLKLESGQIHEFEASDKLEATNLPDLSTDTLMGRDAAGTGSFQEISVGGGVEFSGSNSIRRSALTGDVSSSAGSNSVSLSSLAITGKIGVTPQLADEILLADNDDGGALKKSSLTNIFTLMGGVPVGMIMAYAGTSYPTNWFYCDGSEVSRTTYADLFAVIGTTFGAGDGSTTFNIPDLRGRVVAGKDNMNNIAGTGGGDAGRLTSGSKAGVDGDTLGASGGVEEHLLLDEESGVPAHTHPYVDRYHNTNTNRGTGSANTAQAGLTSINTTTSANTVADASEAHTNVQPTLVLNYMIKFA